MKRTLLAIATIIALLLPAIGSPDAASANLTEGPCGGAGGVTCALGDVSDPLLICPITDVAAHADWKQDKSRTETVDYVLVDDCANIAVRGVYDTGSHDAYEILYAGSSITNASWRCSQNPWTFQNQPPTCSPTSPALVADAASMLAAQTPRTHLPLSVGPLSLISRQTLNGQLQNAIKALPPYSPALFGTPGTPVASGALVPTATLPPASGPATKPQTTTSSTLPTVKSGDSGDTVTAIQYLLRQAGQDLDADGDFGDQTDAAVRAFQKAKGLTVDGIVGSQTWTALFVTVKKGDQGDAVSAAQTLLAARGQDAGVDGDFGDQTDAAVRAFQKAKGLTVDGVVGSQTWAALVAAT
jgi:peptidoglycan hydrolase-like protein with peptidoglycan-binding domain